MECPSKSIRHNRRGRGGSIVLHLLVKKFVLLGISNGLRNIAAHVEEVPIPFIERTKRSSSDLCSICSEIVCNMFTSKFCAKVLVVETEAK